MINIMEILEMMKKPLADDFGILLPFGADPTKVINLCLSEAEKKYYADQQKLFAVRDILHSLRNVRNRYAHPRDMTVDVELQSVLAIKNALADLDKFGILSSENYVSVHREIESLEAKLLTAKMLAEAKPEKKVGQAPSIDSKLIGLIEEESLVTAELGEIIWNLGNALDCKMKIDADWNNLPKFTTENESLVEQVCEQSNEQREFNYYSQISNILSMKSVIDIAKKVCVFYNIVAGSASAEGHFTNLDLFLESRRNRAKEKLISIQKAMLASHKISINECVVNENTIDFILDHDRATIDSFTRFMEDGVIIEREAQQTYIDAINAIVKDYLDSHFA